MEAPEKELDSMAGMGRFRPLDLNFSFEPEAKAPVSKREWNDHDFAPGILAKAAPPSLELPPGVEIGPVKIYKGNLRRKTEPEEGHFTKGHHKHGGSCECSGSECKCADGTVGKLAFKPGQKVRHKRTGQIYEMVKTLCVTADECYCLMKSNGKVDECLIYPEEVTAI